MRKGARWIETTTPMVPRLSSGLSRATRTPPKAPSSKTRACAIASRVSSHQSPGVIAASAWSRILRRGRAEPASTAMGPNFQRRPTATSYVTSAVALSGRTTARCVTSAVAHPVAPSAFAIAERVAS